MPDPITALGLPAAIGRRIMAPPQALLPGGPGVRSAWAPMGKRNLYFGGAGQIVGTVKRKADPANLPLRRRVFLYDERTGLQIAETWSAAATGAYAFSNIDPRRRYSVVVYDYTGDYRAEIADRLAPDPMPGVLP